MIIDTHAHIYDSAFANDIEQVICRAKEAGVQKMIIPGTKPEDADVIIKLCEKNPNVCYPALAIHPEDMSEDILSQFKELVKKFECYKFIAIGEAGLDLHFDKSRLAEQKQLLNMQIDLASELNLPIILHCRDAFAELLDVVEFKKNKNVKGVFHCFVGQLSDAQKVIDLGFKIGIGGVVTFKSSNVKDVLRKIGLENVVLETDCPYLSPVPMRGKRNEPSNLRYVIDFLSKELDVSQEYIEDITTKNAIDLFGIK